MVNYVLSRVLRELNVSYCVVETARPVAPFEPKPWRTLYVVFCHNRSISIPRDETHVVGLITRSHLKSRISKETAVNAIKTNSN